MKPSELGKNKLIQTNYLQLFPSTVFVQKICMGTVRAWEGKQRTQLPATLRDQTANVLILLTGIWNNKRQSGLSLNVSDLELIDKTIESPF